MNGKFNLFIKCIICFCAYFYSVNSFAAYTYSDYKIKCGSGVIKPFEDIAECFILPNVYKSYSVLTDWSSETATTRILKVAYQASFGLTSVNLTEYRTVTLVTPPPPDLCLEKKGRLFNAVANDQGQICVNQCRASPIKIVQQCEIGQMLCLGTWAGQYRYDGTKCNGSEVSVPATDMTEDPEQLDEGLKEKLTPFECFKKGLSSGTVNGKTICIPNNGQGDTKSKETSSETVTNPDGSTTTTTTTTTKTDSGGKITTETETKTETKDKNGVSTGTASGVAKTEVDKESHCKKNPNDDVCKAGTASGGCDKAFACSGDVISCEATKVGWLDFCASEKSRASEVAALADFEKSPFVLEGNKILSGDGKEASAVSNALGMDGSNSFDFKNLINTEGFLSGGSLSDHSFSVYGKSIVVPFSKMNYWLKLIGDLAVMVTFMACIRIVLGGFK